MNSVFPASGLGLLGWVRQQVNRINRYSLAGIERQDRPIGRAVPDFLVVAVLSTESKKSP